MKKRFIFALTVVFGLAAFTVLFNSADKAFAADNGIRTNASYEASTDKNKPRQGHAEIEKRVNPNLSVNGRIDSKYFPSNNSAPPQHDTQVRLESSYQTDNCTFFGQVVKDINTGEVQYTGGASCKW